VLYISRTSIWWGKGRTKENLVVECTGMGRRSEAELFPGEAKTPLALREKQGESSRAYAVRDYRLGEAVGRHGCTRNETPAELKRSGNRLLQGSEVAVGMRWRHSHGRVDGRRRSRTVRGSSRARVVLATAPGETDTRVADGILWCSPADESVY